MNWQNIFQKQFIKYNFGIVNLYPTEGRHRVFLTILILIDVHYHKNKQIISTKVMNNMLFSEKKFKEQTVALLRFVYSCFIKQKF